MLLKKKNIIKLTRNYINTNETESTEIEKNLQKEVGEKLQEVALAKRKKENEPMNTKELPAKQKQMIHWKNKAEKDQKKRRYKGDFIFPNVLGGRNLNNKGNTVWSMDFTKVKTELQGQESSCHYMLVILDQFARVIIYSKVFYLSKGRGSVTASKVVKDL